MNERTETLKGEGDTKVTISTRVRRECDNCGEPATKKISYCYVNGRRDPRSSMYGQDDCTWCSDHGAYACDDCEKEVKRVCCPDEMKWGGTWTLSENNAHMFLEWVDRSATEDEMQRLALGER